jgi:hypothetical protein
MRRGRSENVECGMWNAEWSNSSLIPHFAFDIRHSAFAFMIYDDLFTFYRFWLGWIVTIYATIITVQSLYTWYIWLAGQDRYIGMLRRYILVQGLRLRFKAFWGDVIICVLLTVAFLMLWRAHYVMQGLDTAMRSLPHGQLTGHF